jgi:hypothetical protein
LQLAALLAAESLSDFDDDSDVESAAFVVPLEPPLKSVAYQPLPLSWKPAAVSVFAYALLPQLGQVSMGASLIF